MGDGEYRRYVLIITLSHWMRSVEDTRGRVAGGLRAAQHAVFENVLRTVDHEIQFQDRDLCRHCRIDFLCCSFYYSDHDNQR